MGFTIEYLPLSKIKPNLSIRMTQHMIKLRQVWGDCIHLMAVHKNKSDDSFSIISGYDRYEFLRKHTNHKYVPCLVIDSCSSSNIKSLFQRYNKKQLLNYFPNRVVELITPRSWSIIRSFLKQEPRFMSLNRSQQLKVLVLAIRYKKTAIRSMRALVHELSRN